MDVLDDGRQHARVTGRMDAVAEVEDVPWLPTVVGEHRRGTAEGDLGAGEDERRVEVALNGNVRPEALASGADRRPPVESDHLGAGSGHRLEEVVATDAEMNAGHSRVALGQLGEHASRVRQDEVLVVGGRERSGPGVEQLKRRGPGG